MKRSFSARMKAVRKKLGLSQAQAAQAWGFDLGTFQAWEQEYRNPAGLYREKLEKILRKIEEG